MIINYKTSQFTRHDWSSPQAWTISDHNYSPPRAQGLRVARVKVAILLAVITIFAIFPAPCEAGNPISVAGLTVTLSATSLSFGLVSVGMTSATRTVTLKNASNATLAIASVTITGTNASDFAQSNTCGSSVAIAASCTISVTMTPTGTGPRDATLIISDSGPGGSQSVILKGVAVVPTIDIAPSSLSFASRAIGTTSAAQIIYVTNVGPGTLVITNLGITGADPGDFAPTANCIGPVLPELSCTIAVTFTPIAGGSRTASLSITDNAGNGIQAVSLSGTGTGSGSGGSANPAAGVSLSPLTLSFSSQPIATTSSGQTITLSNGNTSTLSISALVIGGTNSGDFAEVGSTCGASVAADGTCTIEVTFTPSGAGQRSATLSVIDNASGSPQTASCTGTGIPDVILSWTASTTPEIVGYDIYRGTASGGESGTPLNSTPVSGTTYVDSSVKAGTTYYYVLTSVGPGGEQSPRSNETEAQVPSS